MTAGDRTRHEYRLRLEQEAAAKVPDSGAPIEGEPAPPDARQRANRLENQAQWMDLQIRAAMERGEFDDLPGAGKPIPGLDAPHDPDWWLKSLIERERITGVLPPALALRTENEGLEDVLDKEVTEDGVRRVLEDFNARVVDARRQLTGGPPVVTPLRDIDHELDAWSARRVERRARQEALRSQAQRQHASNASTSWFRRLLDRANPSVG